MFHLNIYFIYNNDIITITILIGAYNMENYTPNLIGERLPVMAYVSPETFQRIEDMRGDVSRSRFIGKLIQKSIA
jgi:hypothetical protein